MSVVVLATLADCEAVIERGLHSFVEVGQALLTIRDQGLYSRSHKTFEDYCQDRWGFSRIRAYQMMGASETVGVLSTFNKSLPTPSSSRQAEALSKLKDQPEQLAEAWSEVIEISDGKPTAKVVKEVVSRYVAESKGNGQTRHQEIRGMAPEDRETCPYCGQDLPDRLQIPPESRRNK